MTSTSTSSQADRDAAADLGRAHHDTRLSTTTSIEQAIDRVNSGSKPLASYVFSRSRALAERVIREIPAGATVVNHAIMHYLVPQLPFGGVGTSGMGSYHGFWGSEAFSHRKSVLHRTARPDPSIIYPPYTAEKRRLQRKLL